MNRLFARYFPDLPNETKAIENRSNGPVLDGPIIELVNCLLVFSFEAGNIMGKAHKNCIIQV